MIRREYVEPSRRPRPTSSVDASESPTARLYRVQEGDDLRSIASSVYGCEELWIFILQANLRELRDSDRLHAGQILHLPELH